MDDETVWIGVAVDENDAPFGVSFTLTADGVGVIGPVAVSSKNQSRGVGRYLMNATIAAGLDMGVKAFALTQECHNSITLALYLSMGFTAMFHAVYFLGVSHDSETYGMTVREMQIDDLDACDEIHREALGVARRSELRNLLLRPSPESNCSPLICFSSDGQLVGSS